MDQIMDEINIIKNIHQLVDVGTENDDKWFRGHGKPYNELTPGIFRKIQPISSPMDKETDVYETEDYEFALTEEFRRYAPTVLKNPPKRNDHLSWLVLMQHYGTPTRLLDWTENPLIAAYFAVCENPCDDGELWAMLPTTLNDIHGFKNSIATKENSIVRYLADQPMFDGKEEELLKRRKLEKIPVYPVAFQYPMILSRMNSQFSTFTIHPKPRKDCSIPKLLKNETDLTRYIIPAKCKQALLSNLRSLGVNWRTIFQDMASISKDL
ncbi:MAG: FRG domain-containing protein, partial [Candidatus Bathyarchaeota archaeon]|nr:FRG domain-containing protein [Candidatus Bathyarchaeota archaeon]